MAEYIENVTLGTSKLDWAFPFQRTGAFPLDRSSVFSSYEDAVLYATGGGDERGLSGSSYAGQPISVYDKETSTITLYIIDSDRSLKEVGSAPLGDNASIEIVDGKVQLKNFGTSYYAYVPAVKDDEGNITEESKYVLTEGFKAGLEARVVEVEVDGEVTYEIGWYEPSSETIEDVSAKLETLTQKTETLEDAINGEDGINDKILEIEGALNNKAETATTYTKEEVNELISKANHLKYKKVNNLDEIDLDAEDADQYVYLVLIDTSIDGNDKYDEYMVIDGAIEKVGAWDVNLDDYALKSDLDAYVKEADFTATAANFATKTDLNGKVDKEEGKSLISNTDLTKLAGIEEGAQKNYITKVTDDFTVTDGELSLNPLGIDDITGLADTLGSKVDRVFYDVPVFDEDGNPVYEEDGVTQKTERVEGTLLTPTDKEKLDALVIGDEGVEISGKVNAANVEGLGEWITQNRENVTGLFSSAAEGKLNAIEEGAQKNLFDQVNPDQFEIATVDGKTQLNITEIGVSQVTDLETLLNAKVDSSTYNTKVDEIEGAIDDINIALGGINGSISNLADQLNNYVLKQDYEADKTIIMDAITWHELDGTTTV